MEGVEASAPIILEAGTLRELQLQISKAGLPFIKNGSPEKCVTLNVQYHFRQTFCCGEELVRLEAGDARERIKWVGLRQRDDVVRPRIDPKLTLVKILHNERIAHFCDVRDTIDTLGKVGPIFQTDPVSPCRNIRARRSRLIQIRILILYVIRFEPGPAVVVLSIVDVGIKANVHAPPP